MREVSNDRPRSHRRLSPAIVPLALAGTLVATIPAPVPAAGRAESGGDLYSIRLDGTGRRNLTRSPEFDFAPSASPDGRQIAFTTLRGAQPQIYLVNLDGSRLRRVAGTLPGGWLPADPDIAHVAWSRDGRRIAFNAIRSAEPCRECPPWAVFTIRTDGRALRLLAAGARNASWSPGGGQLVVERIAPRAGIPHALAVVSADGSGMRTIATGGSALYQSPLWSRSGTIAFTLSEFSGGTFNDAVALVAGGGGPVRRVAPGSAADWAPDGTRLAFVARGTHALTVAVLDVRTRTRRALGLGSAPRWSPRGEWVAWLSRRGQVVAATRDGRRGRVVTHEQIRLSGGPVWARGGRLVYGLFPD